MRSPGIVVVSHRLNSNSIRCAATHTVCPLPVAAKTVQNESVDRRRAIALTCTTQLAIALPLDSQIGGAA